MLVRTPVGQTGCERSYHKHRHLALGVVLLAPTTAIIAAALTVPVLVMLYLLKLRRRPVRVSTVLFWPVAASDTQANVPLRMIRPSWLLFLHLLILALLVLAAGRPAMNAGPGDADGGERLVLAFDVSASMSAMDAGPGQAPSSRLDAAKARALEFIESRKGGQVAVVAFGARPRLVADFTGSRAVLRDAIATIEPTDEPADVRRLMALVQTLGQSGEDASLGTLLYSDGSLGTHTEALPAPGPVRLERIGPMPDAPRLNAGIVTLAARRESADPAVIRVFVEVLSTASMPRAVPVSLSFNGEPVLRKVVEVPAASTTPGRAAATLDLASTGGGVMRVSIPDDVLAADNAASLVLAAAMRPVIWLVRPEGAGDARDHPGSWLLSEALEELRPARLDRMTQAEYAARVANGDVNAVSLVIFDRIAPAILPRCPTMHFGAIPAIPGLEAATEPNGADEVVLWERAHPILRHVSLDTLAISRAWDIRVAPGGVSLATGTRGSLLALVTDGHARRLVAAFDLSDTNWQLQPGFPVFLASAVDYLTLTGESSLGVSTRTGESVLVEANAGTVTLRGPIDILQVAPTAGRVSIGPISRAGVYATGGTASTSPIAVNLCDATESAIGTRDAPPATTRDAAGIINAEARREVWHWLVAVAVALLMVEWAVYARSSN